jgi:hypothetical protein
MKWTIVLLISLPAHGQTWFGGIWKTVTANSCTVHWNTAVPTIGHIQYGTTVGSYPKYTSNSSAYSTHGTATMTGLTARTTYHFRLISADSSKDWITSLDSTCTTAAVIASTPSVKLGWHASTSSGVSGYDIYRSTISSGYYMLLARTTGLSYNDTTAKVNTTYYYVVRAQNTAGALSSYSNQAMAIVP